MGSLAGTINHFDCSLFLIHNMWNCSALAEACALQSAIWVKLIFPRSWMNFSDRVKTFPHYHQLIENNRFAFLGFSQINSHQLSQCSLYQTRDEQTVRGAVVGLSVLPKLLQTKCLPVQGPLTFLTQCKSSVAVLHASIIFPLWRKTTCVDVKRVQMRRVWMKTDLCIHFDFYNQIIVLSLDRKVEECFLGMHV